MNGVVFSFLTNHEAWVYAFALAALCCLARLTTWKGMQLFVFPSSFSELRGLPLAEGTGLLYRVGRMLNWKWPSFAFDIAFGMLLGMAWSVCAEFGKVAVPAQHSILRNLVFFSLSIVCGLIVTKMRVHYLKPHIRSALRNNV